MAIYNIELDTKPPFGNTLLLLLYIQFVPFINNKNTMMMREDRLSSFHFIHLKQMQPSTIQSSTSIDKHRQANYFIFSLPYKKTNLTTTTTKKPAVMQAHIKLYIAIVQRHYHQNWDRFVCFVNISPHTQCFVRKHYIFERIEKAIGAFV